MKLFQTLLLAIKCLKCKYQSWPFVHTLVLFNLDQARSDVVWILHLGSLEKIACIAKRCGTLEAVECGPWCCTTDALSVSIYIHSVSQTERANLTCLCVVPLREKKSRGVVLVGGETHSWPQRGAEANGSASETVALQKSSRWRGTALTRWSADCELSLHGSICVREINWRLNLRRENHVRGNGFDSVWFCFWV